MGLFDDLFGGFFDFNGDGKTGWDESLLAFKIIEDIEEEEAEEIYQSSFLNDDDAELVEDLILSGELEDVNSWHDSCEDGSE